MYVITCEFSDKYLSIPYAKNTIAYGGSHPSGSFLDTRLKHAITFNTIEDAEKGFQEWKRLYMPTRLDMETYNFKTLTICRIELVPVVVSDTKTHPTSFFDTKNE